MFQELKISCLKAGISVSDFSKSIGKSRTAVASVACGKSKSAGIERAIKAFIEKHSAEVNLTAPVLEIPGHWLTTTEFAEKTGMRPESVANKARTGGFHRVKRSGKKWLIHRSELGV